MTVKTQYDKIQPYMTKDGSVIRELMHPGVHRDVNSKLSLAEATVPTGSETFLHQHRKSEEIYHIISGSGNMVLGRERFRVVTGDTILIPPGIPHKIENTEEVALKILCCCSPPYSHDDTELIVE